MCQLGIKAYAASWPTVYLPTCMQAFRCAVIRYPTQQGVLTIPALSNEAPINRKISSFMD